jgi:hypothetical protein
MTAARSGGLPAIPVPGVDGWRTARASLFVGWRSVVVMASEEHGRGAAALTKRVSLAWALDLAPESQRVGFAGFGGNGPRCRGGV